MDVTTFLQLPFTKEFKLLAGENGLTNQITGVNILDNPNAADWLTPGELIVTSGYFFKETPSAMANFLAHFDRLNIAAVCIKPQIYLTPLPAALLEECNQRGIPLIEIPYGMAFSKILNTVMNLLSNEVNEANQMALDLNSELLEYGLQGKGIEELKGKLERLLGNPILITNGDWSVLTKTIDATFTPYLKQQQHHQLFDKKSFKHLPENFHHSKHPSNFLLNDQTSGTILPVFFNDITYGYMIVFQKNKALTRQDYLALEQTSITIALEIVHQNEKERIQNKVLRDFYRELLFGTHSIEELNTFNIEFDYDIPYTVFIIDFHIANHKEQSLVQQKYEEERAIRKSFAAATFFQHPLFPVIHLFKQGQAIIGLIGRKQANRPNEHLLEAEFFEAFHQYLLAELPKDSFLNFYIGTKQAIENIKESYREAKQILAYQEAQKSQIYFARDFYFELFLRQNIQPEAAEVFIEHYLSPLLTWESGSHAYLLETLTVYLNHQLNLATASRDLFIHRNTLRYRIEKIEGLLGYPLDNPRVILSLQLAIKLLEEYQKNGSVTTLPFFILNEGSVRQITRKNLLYKLLATKIFMKRYDFHVKQFMIEEAIEFLGLKERFTIENRMNRHHKIILALFLSALSGFIDILGLFGIGKMFLSFMSGNSTRLAFYLAEGEFIQALPYIFLIASFVFGAFLGDVVKSRFPGEVLLAILTTETFLIFISFMMIFLDIKDEWSYLPLTIAMGLQNTMHIRVDDKIIGRTFFSGVLHSLGTDISQAMQKNKPWSAPLLDLVIWVVAVSGAFLAGILQPNIPTQTLLGLVLIILLLVIVIIIMLNKKQPDFR